MGAVGVGTSTESTHGVPSFILPFFPFILLHNNFLNFTCISCSSSPTTTTATSVFHRYRQPPAGGAAGGLRVCMYDYIMHTIFNLHVKDIDATVIVPAFQQMDGSTIIPSWKEVRIC